jgi:drug/metabolite transporter (DMT)-like permease
LAFLGCGLLVLGGERESIAEKVWLGYLLAFGAALTWPLYTLIKKKLPPTSPPAIGGFCFGAGLLCFMTHAFIEPRVVLQGRDALYIVIMGLGPFGLSFYCWDYAGRVGRTKILGALAYLTPVISTLGLVIFADKILTIKSSLAMVLIIGGASIGLLDFIPLKTLKKSSLRW